jgi:predicted ester cyclase
MSTEENRQLVRRLFQEVVNEGRVDILDEVFIPGSMIVRSYKESMTLLQSAFSDVQATINHIVTEDDQVVVVFGVEGVHTGPFMGQPPTGKSFYFTGIHYFRIKNGRVVTARYEHDLLGLLAQLGMVPEEIRPDI